MSQFSIGVIITSTNSFNLNLSSGGTGTCSLYDINPANSTTTKLLSTSSWGGSTGNYAFAAGHVYIVLLENYAANALRPIVPLVFTDIWALSPISQSLNANQVVWKSGAKLGWNPMVDNWPTPTNKSLRAYIDTDTSLITPSQSGYNPYLFSPFNIWVKNNTETSLVLSNWIPVNSSYDTNPILPNKSAYLYKSQPMTDLINGSIRLEISETTTPTFSVPVSINFYNTNVNKLSVTKETGATDIISTGTGSAVYNFTAGDELTIGTKPNPSINVTYTNTEPPTISGGITYNPDN